MASRRIGRLAAAVRDERGRIVRASGDDAGHAGATPTDDRPTGGDNSHADSPDRAEPANPGTAFGAEPAAPRRRGRPRGSASRTDTGGTPARKRQAEAGSVRVAAGSGARGARKRGGISAYIIEAHEFLAEITEIKRLELRQDQAEGLGTAIENVEQHFPVLQILTGKWAAIAALVWVAGRIYLPMAKDIAAGQLAPRPPAASQTQPASPGNAPAAPLNSGADLNSGGLLPVLDNAADERALAQEWLTH